MLLTSCDGSAGIAENSTSASPDISSATAASEKPDTAISSETTAVTEPAAGKAFNYIKDPSAVKPLFVNDNNYYTVSDEILFSDLSGQLRGGHMGHAMVEYADGCVLAFSPNCNADNKGHSGRGWMEYRRSTDYGETWNEPEIFEYSYNVFRDSGEKRSVMCEKAVLAPDGAIVLFLLNCDVDENALWEPYYEPEVTLSYDGGESWSKPYKLSSKCGRVYAAMVIDKVIYALCHFENTYFIYTSDDNGKSFTEYSTISGVKSGSFYGTMAQLEDNELIVYTYNTDDENRLQYFISRNLGKSWSPGGRAFFQNKLRNPQLIEFNGSYFIFGRSGSSGENYGSIIVYCSKNGINWDSDHYIKFRTVGLGAYSNAIIVGTLNDSVPDRLLYQSSHAYNRNLTNTYMWKIDMYVLQN